MLYQKIGDLSGGELKYLEVLLLLRTDAKFVLFDEPFSGIEPIYEEIIMQLLIENKYEKGIIITDHNYRNVIEVSDYVMLITNGVLKKIVDENDLKRFGYISGGGLSENDFES